MSDCKSMDTNLKFLFDESSELVDVTQYKNIISLMYLTNTRPDICFVVNTPSQYLVKPRCVHLIAAKHLIRYLIGTTYLGLYYGRDHDYRFSEYMDSEVSQTRRTPHVDVMVWNPP